LKIESTTCFKEIHEKSEIIYKDLRMIKGKGEFNDKLEFFEENDPEY